MRSDVLKKLAIVISFLLVFIAGSSLILTLHFFLDEELSSSLKQITSDLFFVLLLGGLISTGVLTYFFHWLIDRFAKPVEQLSDQLSIQFQNPQASPLNIGSGKVFFKLNASINMAADELHQQRSGLQQELNRLSARLISERDTLAVIIEQLQQGVIVTNQEGSILLFNAASTEMLSFPEQDPPVYLGLGRNMHSIFKAGLVSYALDEANNRSLSNPVHFIADTPNGKFLKVRVLPASKSGVADAGFIFFTEDVSVQLKGKTIQQVRFDDTIRNLRDAAAGVRMTAENLVDYPNAPEAQRLQFLNILIQEAEKMEGSLNTIQKQSDNHDFESGLSLISAHAFLELLNRLAEKLNIHIETGEPKDSHAFLADAFSFPLSLIYIISKTSLNQPPHVTISEHDAYILIAIELNFGDVTLEQIESILKEQPSIEGVSLPYQIIDVFSRHKVEWWMDDVPDSLHVQLKFMIPAVKAAPVQKPTQPEKVTAFDFDLFRVNLSDELSTIKLKNLTATVFDTETTGLYPSDGDRLISIGAVRLVNGKLQDQTFHELIDPDRKVPKASTAIHGITNEMVQGKPKVDKVLRNFHLFCDGSLLIAHNAAFDMRFLELEQKQAGVEFSQPILDTLLLSTILHPHLEGHSLDVLMPRYGLETGKRHDALGDALMTASLFLKMIPFLEQAGIITLQDALNATKNSLYSKLKY